MENKHIAKRLAKVLFKSKSEESDDFAIQLFVEKVVLPSDMDSYTEDEIESLINEYLNT